MISDPIVWPVVGADLLIDVAGAELLFLELLLFLDLCLFVDGIETLAESLEGTGFVRMLISLILALGDNACWYVSGTDS